MKIKNTTQEFFEQFQQPKAFEVIGSPVAMEYIVNINEYFDDVKQFENIVHILDHATQHDTLEIKLSTNGGAVHAVLPLLAAMQNTEAQVFVHAISDVASAGTFILMAADDVIVNDHATIMFHTCQFSPGYGAGNNIESRVEHTKKMNRKLLTEAYEKFFSVIELESIFSGTEIYLDKEEFDARYIARRLLLEQEQEDMLAKYKEQQEAPKKKEKKPVQKPKE